MDRQGIDLSFEPRFHREISPGKYECKTIMPGKSNLVADLARKEAGLIKEQGGVIIHIAMECDPLKLEQTLIQRLTKNET